ncbi:hypothetical protein [Actinoplanes sp. CA-252034]|uniref:hypothetical protein n=1 Tax=Actinoplanes sp. CA-252034 TaxID=3239906 RepID=UPI003D97591A
MPDISELLGPAAIRLEPARQPEFRQLVRARAKRRRRHRRITGSVAVVILAVGAGTVMRGPTPEDPAGPRKPMVAVEVTGTVQRVGGPMGTPPVGMSGSVRFEDAAGTTITAALGAGGSFSIAVPPGQYVVTGIPAEAGRPSCRAEAPVLVSDTRLDGVEVDCHVR